MSDALQPAPGDSAFWRFSLRFYALPGVASACLALQDEADIDVNLLLFLLFLAGEGLAVDAAGVRVLDERVALWRDTVVKPLRTLRRRLKPGIPPIAAPISERYRDHIKRSELEAERIEQQVLEGGSNVAAPSALPRGQIARANVNALAETGTMLASAPLAAVLAAFDSLKV